MIDKKLLPYTNARNWPHVIHMGFVTEWVRRMRQEWSETSQCPELLSQFKPSPRMALRDFTVMLNALVLTDPVIGRFDALVAGLHETYLSYLQRFKEHRRAARREEKEIDTQQTYSH